MGSFAGHSVSVSTFEIIRLFFRRLFLLMLRFDGLLFWTFFSTPEDLVQFALHIPLNSTLHYSFGHQKTFFSTTDQKLSCFSYAWRRLMMSEEDLWCLKKPGEAFHTRRHRPRRRHQESRLVAPQTPIWLSHTRFAWQTKLWLSEDVSVRFNQNLLK